jgi:hypothetical protein
VAQFNADEQLWRSLEAKRRSRRKMRPRILARLRRQLDLLEFANSRPLEDCVGQFSAAWDLADHPGCKSEASIVHLDDLGILEPQKFPPVSIKFHERGIYPFALIVHRSELV